MLKEVENLGDLRTRLSIPWIIQVFGGVTNVVLELFKDGNFDKIEGFPVNEPYLLLVAVMFLAPCFMAFLCQTLSDKTNRWANIIVGAFYVIMLAVDLVESLIFDPSVLVINPLFGVVWSALIVWYAWNSKKKE
jgi:hypothetical protein